MARETAVIAAEETTRISVDATRVGIATDAVVVREIATVERTVETEEEAVMARDVPGEACKCLGFDQIGTDSLSFNLKPVSKRLETQSFMLKREIRSFEVTLHEEQKVECQANIKRNHKK